MKQYARFFTAAAMVLMLSACSQGTSFNISNPFASTTDVTSVYTSQFQDVPIPMDMKSDLNATLVTVNQDGQKVGLETLTGRVEPASLAAAMVHNLGNQNWSLRGSVQGKRTMQLFEKDQRFLVVIVEDALVNTKMEIWMLNRLVGFGANVFGSPSTNPFPDMPISSGTASGSASGSVNSRPLSN